MISNFESLLAEPSITDRYSVQIGTLYLDIKLMSRRVRPQSLFLITIQGTVPLYNDHSQC